MNFDVYLNHVVTIKIASGEEVISKIAEIKEESLLLENALSVAPGPQGVGLMPTLFTGDAENMIEIRRDSIVMISPTNESVSVKYLEATTGIQVPSKRLIVG